MKNIRLINYLILLAIGFLLVPSCQYETIELGTCTDLDFADDIQTIFNGNCAVSCHTGSSAFAGLDLSSGNAYDNLKDGGYFDIDNPSDSKLYEKAKSGHNEASADDACKILGWIEEGAEEGEKLIDSVKYNDDIQPLFYNYCMKCHVTGHSTNLDLTPNKSYQSIIDGDYIDLNTPENSLLYTKPNGGHYDEATESDYENILNWIKQGALEPETDYLVTSVNYDNILTIFENYCISCHNETDLEGGIDLTSANAYQSIIDSNLVDTLNPASSLIYSKLVNGHSDDATGIEYWKILTWIEDGAPIIIPPVSFSNDIQPIFNAKCTGCHGSSGGLILEEGSSYISLQGNSLTSGDPFINISSPDQSVIYTQMLSGHNGATTDEAALVLKWIEEGASDNK